MQSFVPSTDTRRKSDSSLSDTKSGEMFSRADIRPSNAPIAPGKLEQLRAKIDGNFKQFAELISHIRKPHPETGDGSDLEQEPDDRAIVRLIEGGLSDLRHLGVDGLDTLLQGFETSITDGLVDDKSYWMEHLIQAAVKFPEGSKMGTEITDKFLTQLWNDLQHPPQSYLGGDYQYRSADGSFNSLIHPQLGKANTPYARSVQPRTMQTGAPPDPAVIFDSIMARKHHEKHPNEISSMLFYLASIIIHDLFRTDHDDYRNSKTSSYLDLSPLYGSVWEEQRQMRTFKDGKIKPDCFAEKRLLLFPPGVGCLLIMFGRFHNYVVEQLALINERGQFNKPTEGAKGPHAKTWEKYDEDLFQTGRLITGGLYINIILIDYVRTILNLNQTNSNWQLNPRANIKNGPPMGVGNQVSAEFNLVYRWHSAISDRDEAWTNDLMKQLFPDINLENISPHDFIVKASELEESLAEDPWKRDFHGLKRQENGSLKDDDLVKILTESIDDCANSFGAQRVPMCMKAVEMLGIQQARAWNLSSLNEFRKFFGLEPHRTFESINPHIADQLKHLYDHPDHVELYPGLVVEEAKLPMVPGAGLTPSFTVSRAVLADAVALVRGDRFYTIDYHPRKLTNWGYNEVQYDKNIDNGCMFYKLFLRAFPNHFEPNSIYAHYPLTVPPKMRSVLTTLGKASYYSFEKPKTTSHPKMVVTYAAADAILGNQEAFRVTWGKAIEFLMGSPAKNFMLAGDGYKNRQSREMMEKALYIPQWEQEVKKYYETVTRKLLREKSYNLAGTNYVDIIRDVGNIAHVHFAADLWSLPLKTKDRPGVFTEHELYLITVAVFICVFFDLDPANSFPLRQVAHTATHQPGELVEANVRLVKGESFAGGMFAHILDALAPDALFPPHSALKDYGTHMIQRLLKSGMSVKDLVWGHIMGTAGGMVPNQGQLFGQTMDYFMHEGYEHWPRIQELAARDDDDAFDELMHYFLEGSRLYGETGVFRYVTKETEIKDGEKTWKFKPGDTVMVNLKAASRDEIAFPDPDKVVLTRPIDSYVHLGAGPHQCLGLRMTRVALTTMLKEIAKLGVVKPAPGPQGKVHKVLSDFGPEVEPLPKSWHYHKFLTENHDKYFPFPQSMKIMWKYPE